MEMPRKLEVKYIIHEGNIVTINNILYAIYL